MKTMILILAVALFSVDSFSQFLIIHKNVESSLHAKISEIDSITFCPETVNYAGKDYNVVVIGDQCWLKENLDLGNRIPGSSNQTNNGGTNIIEKYCYNDLDANCIVYGGLYQWDEAMQYVTTEGAQGICPDGWHIPTLAEFEILVAFVDDDGNALKAIGEGYGEGTGTNTSGFSALMAGLNAEGTFIALDELAFFFTSSESNSTYYPYFFAIEAGYSILSFGDDPVELGLSVRCIKD